VTHYLIWKVPLGVSAINHLSMLGFSNRLEPDRKPSPIPDMPSFEEMDANQDGVIDRQEYSAAVKSAQPNPYLDASIFGLE